MNDMEIIQMKNAMEIFKVLPRNNCRDCRVPTCLAFAAAVFKGEKNLEECPHVDKTVIEAFSQCNSDAQALDSEEEREFTQLKEKAAQVDLASSAERLCGKFFGDALTLKVLGKDFRVDSKGNVTSECHVHRWVTTPILDYVTSCSGKPISGNWVPLRELKNGAVWAGLFGQRCEKPLKQIADAHPDMFEFMVQIFSAKPAPSAFNSDIAVVLHPLPRIPILICYWKPDGALESSLNLFFDDTAEDNLTIDSIYRIVTGLAVMFEKIAITHGQ